MLAEFLASFSQHAPRLSLFWQWEDVRGMGEVVCLLVAKCPHKAWVYAVYFHSHSHTA